MDPRLLYMLMHGYVPLTPPASSLCPSPHGKTRDLNSGFLLEGFLWVAFPFSGGKLKKKKSMCNI